MKRPVVIGILLTALAIVGLGIGAVIFFTANNGFPSNNPFDRRNISSVAEESKTLKVGTERPLILKVTDAAGDVTVTAADVDTVQVKAIKTAYDSSHARADEEVKGINYSIEQSGSVITLKYELPKSMNFNNNVNTVDFVVMVPNETTVSVDTSMGEVSIAGTKGDVDINNDFGDVTIENIAGALIVKNSSGKVTATDIQAGSGDIDLHSDFGSVTLTQSRGQNITLDSSSGANTLENVRAAGDLIAKTDFGNTKFEGGSAASLNIESSSGKVSLIKLRISRELKVDSGFGEIELQQAMAGSYDLHTSSGSISVDGASSRIKAYTDFGNITIAGAESVTLDLKTNSGTVDFSGALGDGPHFVRSDFGAISLILPADSKLNVDLKTNFGKISSDIPVLVTVTESSNSEKSHVVGSTNGGGASLTVSTSSGNITIGVANK